MLYAFTDATCFGPFYGPLSGIQIYNQNISMYIIEYEFCVLTNFTVRFTGYCIRFIII
jgi:hypothetical protein